MDLFLFINLFIIVFLVLQGKFYAQDLSTVVHDFFGHPCTMTINLNILDGRKNDDKIFNLNFNMAVLLDKIFNLNFKILKYFNLNLNILDAK